MVRSLSTLRDAGGCQRRLLSRATSVGATPPTLPHCRTVFRRAASSVQTTSSNIMKASPPQFQKVKFQKEDMISVAREVPEFKYYLFGEDTFPNPYNGISLDTPVLPDITLPSIKDLQKPKLEYSSLENGLKIISCDRDGMTSSIGLFVNTGSRWETHENAGVSHMIELTAFRSTAHLSYLRTVKSIEAIGAQASCHAGREHIVYTAECMRDKMPLMIPLLIGNVLFPRLLSWEVTDCHRYVLKAQKRLEGKPEGHLTELTHQTAYHNTTLGNKLYATEKSLQHFTPDTIRNFMMQHFSPDNMVVMGVNVDHKELTKWLMRTFVDYNSIPSNADRQLEAPKYTGGDFRLESDLPSCHAVLCFETKGWNSEDLEVATVLHTLMGGGGAFSSGGPGKGLHTRLYNEVLNRHGWIESCCAFNTMYSDSGLFGMYTVFNPQQGTDAVCVMAEQLARMRSVTSAELSRAKACLKASIFMNLESRSILCEDVARQFLMSGRVVGAEEFSAAIDAVTEASIAKFCDKLMSQPHTFTALGDVSTLPHPSDIGKILQGSAKEEGSSQKRETSSSKK